MIAQSIIKSENHHSFVLRQNATDDTKNQISLIFTKRGSRLIITDIFHEINLLDIKYGVIVLTKSDLVDESELENKKGQSSDRG